MKRDTLRRVDSGLSRPDETLCDTRTGAGSVEKKYVVAARKKGNQTPLIIPTIIMIIMIIVKEQA